MPYNRFSFLPGTGVVIPLLCVLWYALPTAGADVGETAALDVRDRETAVAFLARFRDTPAATTAPERRIVARLTFLPKFLARQTAHKVLSRSVWTHALQIAAAGAPPDRRDALCLVLVLLRIDRAPSAHFSGALDRCVFRVSPEVAESVLEDVAEGLVDGSLTAVFEGVVQRVDVASVDGYREHIVTWDEPVLTLRRSGRELWRGPVRDLANTDTLTPGFVPLRPTAQLRRDTVLDLEAEDMNGLVYYGDWQRDARGWYAREFALTCSGTGFAVVHARNMPAVTRHAFVRPLPPGTYQVWVDPAKHAARWRDHILEVQLADAKNTIRWYYSRTEEDFVTCEPLHVTEPATELVLRAVQSGGGGTGAAPDMREMVTMLDRIRIDRIEWHVE